MEDKGKKTLKYVGAGAAVALLVAGAYVLGSVHPLQRVSAARTDGDFEVVDKHPPLSKPQFQPFGQSGNFDPFQEMQQLQQQMDAMFNQAFGRMNTNSLFSQHFGTPSALPEMDLEEHDKEFVVRLDMPGLDEASIQVEVKDDSLSISGKRVQEGGQGGSVLHNERFASSFERKMTLPSRVDPGTLKTDYKDGVLTIRVEKRK